MSAIVRTRAVPHTREIIADPFCHRASETTTDRLGSTKEVVLRFIKSQCNSALNFKERVRPRPKECVLQKETSFDSSRIDPKIDSLLAREKVSQTSSNFPPTFQTSIETLCTPFLRCPLEYLVSRLPATLFAPQSKSPRATGLLTGGPQHRARIFPVYEVWETGTVGQGGREEANEKRPSEGGGGWHTAEAGAQRWDSLGHGTPLLSLCSGLFVRACTPFALNRRTWCTLWEGSSF